MVVVLVFFVSTPEVPSLVVVRVQVANPVVAKVVTGVVLFLVVLVAAVAGVLLLATQDKTGVLEEIHKAGVVAAVALLELLAHQVVLAHNQHTVLALVVEVVVLQLLLLLEVVALVALVAVAVAVAVLL